MGKIQRQFFMAFIFTASLFASSVYSAPTFANGCGSRYSYTEEWVSTIRARGWNLEAKDYDAIVKIVKEQLGVEVKFALYASDLLFALNYTYKTTTNSNAKHKEATELVEKLLVHLHKTGRLPRTIVL